MNWFNILLSCVCGGEAGGSLSFRHIWVVACSAPQLIWLYSISERLGWPTQPSRFNTSSPRNQSWLSIVEHSVVVLSVRNWPGCLLFTMLMFPLSVTAHSPLPFLILRAPEQHLATPQSFLLANFIESTPKLLPCSSILGFTGTIQWCPTPPELALLLSSVGSSYQKCNGLLSGVPVSGAWTPFCPEPCSGCFLTHHYQSQVPRFKLLKGTTEQQVPA